MNPEPPLNILAKLAFNDVMASMPRITTIPDHPPAQTPASPALAEADRHAHQESLMRRVAANQDRAAFAELFEYFAPRIKSYLMKNGARPDQAEELAQETMISVWDRAETYNPDQARLSTWIFTIARNRRIDFLRKFARPMPDPTDPVFEPDQPAAPGKNLEAAQESERIANALKKLPAEQSELLYKSFFEDKTHGDIAAETSLPLGTVKSRIRLALDRLRKDMKGEDYGR